MIKWEVSLVESVSTKSLSKQDTVNDDVKNDDGGIYVVRCIV